MSRIDRLPAIPLIASDPYLSIWMPADTMTQTDSIHWSGPIKPIRGTMTVDGAACRFLGAGCDPEAALTELRVSATQTALISEFRGVQLETRFITPALPDDLDVLSMPVTLITFRASMLDGAKHDVSIQLHLSDRFCYDGEIRPAMTSAAMTLDGRSAAWCGQSTQKPLCHSGDHVTIDWGYLYLTGDGETQPVGDGLQMTAKLTDDTVRAVIAYDDIASINYFGDLCKAWYRRNGLQITDAIHYAFEHFNELLNRCDRLDAEIERDSLAAGGEDYAILTAASWRQVMAAHKLIATPEGEMAYLSKENDSNGCIGTVDISYPSAPIFLKYCPQLVNALCRGVLKFAEMPVWEEDYAPHDIGRYPYATGQVYAACDRSVFRQNAAVHPPYYLYPAGTNAYNPHDQMPVEECGNMLIMLYAALRATGDASLIQAHRATLAKWAKYLCEYGEDPGEQLCTDDFAGHLAHNVNLAAKALVGVACYARLVATLGEDASAWERETARLRDSFLARAQKPGGGPLTFDGVGWSMKYNLVWDEILGLDLLPREYYAEEVGSYAARMNRYGLPLDSRKTYTKSDWELWVATMAQSKEEFCRFIAPVAAYLRETPSRVPFSDWYDTVTGKYEHFIARAVQGGLYMPMLKHWK